MRDPNPYRPPDAAGPTADDDAASALADSLDRRGHSREVIASRLARRGYDATAIATAIARLPARSRASSRLRGWLGGRGPFLLLGLGVMILGAAVGLGNATGRLPTVPLLGRALFALGLYLCWASQS